MSTVTRSAEQTLIAPPDGESPERGLDRVATCRAVDQVGVTDEGREVSVDGVVVEVPG